MPESFLLDLRYAWRVLRKSPSFTMVALITLTLSIGGNMVVFGVLNAVLLEPLAVHDPASLYQLRHKTWMTGRLLTSSYPTFEDYRRRNITFSGMAAINAYADAEMTWDQHSVRSVRGDWVSGNYFDLLGVQPESGRFFHAADEHGPNSAPYVVLSNALWRSAFHGDRGVVGTTVALEQHSFTVIGVAPAQFHGMERFVFPDYWLPMVDVQEFGASDFFQNRSDFGVTILGRLKPGVTPQQATADLNGIAAELGKEYPQTDDGQSLRLIHPGLFGDEGEVIRGFLWSVTVLALLVLAAACANLATLFAARAADRGHELALRAALGSSRRRLARQLLTEALMLSLMGGAGGLLGAYLVLGALNRWQPTFGWRLAVTADARVCVAGLAFTLGSALLFGMVPARQAWHSSPLQGLKSGASGTLFWRRFALRDLLLGAQIAICTLLVTASLVAVRSMQQTLHAPLGFQPQGAMLADIDLKNDPGGAFVDTRKEILQAVQGLAGVTAAGFVSRTPMTGGMHGIPVFPPGTAEFTLDHAVLAPYVFSLSPGYLDAAGTRLLQGRDVRWQDTAKTPYIAVVNQTFARRMWAATPPVGQRFIVSGHLTEVVGVVEDGKYHDLHESPQPVAYVPFAQSGEDDGHLVVRSRRAPNEMAGALEQTLRGMAPNVSVTVQSWPESLTAELFPARAAAVALGMMGVMSAMLAVTGIFGMAAYSVSRRRKELGIRMALGARKTQVLRAAVGRPVLLLCVGSLLGLLGGLVTRGLLGRIVYQPSPGDPVVIGGAVLTMALLGIVASAVPARRALGIDPSNLMREE